MPSILSITSYIPTEWFDNTAPALNAANLNHIEQGIKNATDELLSLIARVEYLENNVAPHTHPIDEIVDLQTELDRCPKGTWERVDDTLIIDIEPLEVP